MATDSRVPRSASTFGLRIDPTGTHLSSTLKLEELRVLLASRPMPATESTLRVAIVGQNLLGKPTASARRITFERLRELYGLDPNMLVFRALNDLWDADDGAHPMIALLCSTARDPILRAMTPFVLRLPIGATVTPHEFAEEADHQFPGKFVASSREAPRAERVVFLGRRQGYCQGNKRRNEPGRRLVQPHLLTLSYWVISAASAVRPSSQRCGPRC